MKILLIVLAILMICQGIAVFNCKKYMAYIARQPMNILIEDIRLK